ncbi:MAG TPA: DUF2934 domain-containing protein [Azonexus sp.]|nr:DUF2934 domain-containing protein [Azonexus sp.]
MKATEAVSRTTKKSVGASTPHSVAVNVKNPNKKKAKSPRASEPDIHQMIQTEAYFRYEKRGFEAGAELQDWLDAEREVRGMMDVERQAEPF